ncbi:ABC transporter substrate-binding protein [Paenibacillus solisilvae]|uniref:ABC transporter substrate-binding protein n=1 Tax=Paenibacillus solisilvae TaxID=2486751 RepID=A0ABW0W346_9BACL
MKGLRSKGFIFLLVLAFVLSACSSGTPKTEGTNNGTNEPAANTTGNAAEPADTNAANDPKADNKAEEGTAAEKVTDPNMSGNVTFWTFTADIYKPIIKEFNKVYPNIKINLVGIDFGGMHDKLQTTLAAGKGAPDVAQVEQGQFPRYLKGDVLEDLLKPPFNAGQYKDDTSEYNWIRWMSQDNSKLYGMPWDVTPGVLYYRADIFEELGIESDPEALAEVIADGDGWINVVETLTANKKYGMEWRDGPVHWAGDVTGYFDKDFNWLRNTDELVQVLDVTKRQNQLKVAPHMSGMYDDKGKALTKSGQLTAMALGSWGARDIAKIFPDQKGKWRATALPLNISVGMGGSTFVFPKQASAANKEASWKFVEWMQFSEEAWKIFVANSVQPGWKSITQLGWYQELKNDYLGGQNDFALYSSLADRIPPRKITALDGKAWDIWLKGVLNALDKNVDSKTTLNNIEDEIKRKLTPEIDKLKKELATP